MARGKPKRAGGKHFYAGGKKISRADQRRLGPSKARGTTRPAPVKSWRLAFHDRGPQEPTHRPHSRSLAKPVLPKMT